MHVGIDARFFGPHGTGLGRYTAELVLNLLRLEPNLRLTLVVQDEAQTGVPHDPRVRLAAFPHRWYTVAEQIRLPSLLRRLEVDLWHFPHFNVPLLAPRPFVATVHDLILHDFPTERATTLGYTQYAMKRLAYRLVIGRAIARAERIVTVTQTSANALRGHFPQAAKKIVVTYEGPSDLGASDDRQSDADLVRALRVRQPFVLSVGNAYPHKNLELLLDALPHLRAAHPTVQLVIAGPDDFFHRRLRAAAAARGLRNPQDVNFPGFVTDRQLVALYRQAAVYVFPSRAEGFGLPGLEAMSLGVPVAAARASCLPEVFGTAAEYFDPDDARGAARVIGRFLSDSGWRQQHRARGYEQVSRYSWQRLAAETFAVYRTVVAMRTHASTDRPT